MRQFFSWRIWAAFAALLGLFVMLRVVLPADAGSAATISLHPPDRTVDFVSLIYVVQPSADFVVHGGLVTGSADFVIDSQRTMHIAAGTLADMQCDNYTQVGKCAVLADLLGDAVIWFALVPVADSFRINAPPIIDLLDNGVVRLQNGWLVRVANTIDRSCKQPTDSLKEFLSRFGPKSTTVIDIASQRVIQVKCSSAVTANSDGTPSTDSSTTTTTPLPVNTGVTAVTDENGGSAPATTTG